MYGLLGSSAEDKQRVVYDTGHDISRAEMIKETLAWPGKYLGGMKIKDNGQFEHPSVP